MTSSAPAARDWRDNAACRDVDSDLFFPVGTGDHAANAIQARAALAVCAGCSVRRECLAFAVGKAEKHGVWGGMTEDARNAAGRHLTEGAA